MECTAPQHSVEWDSHLPGLASGAVANALRNLIGPFDVTCGTLLAHIQLDINPKTQIVFNGAAIQALIP